METYHTLVDAMVLLLQRGYGQRSLVLFVPLSRQLLEKTNIKSIAEKKMEDKEQEHQQSDRHKKQDVEY